MSALATIATPIGPLTLEATDSGLRSVTFGRAGRARSGSPAAARQLALAQRELREYFAGERSSFDVPLDWPAMTPFRRAVLGELVSVSYGEVVTYGELASRVGRPGAARAVGSAMAANPLAVVVPCHRVIRSGGVLGNYGDDPRKKVWLLSHEGSLPGSGPSGQL